MDQLIPMRDTFIALMLLCCIPHFERYLSDVFSVPATAIFVCFFPARFGVMGNKQLRSAVAEKKMMNMTRQYEMDPLGTQIIV